MKKNGITRSCLTCGKDVYVSIARMKAGRGKYCSKSCGNKATSTKHGHTTHTASSRTYNSWAMMKSRCSNPKNPKYYMYGAKGIGFCDEWADFDAFLSDMGVRPKGTTLDRIDGNKGYSKDNCRWASSRQQQRNIKRNVIISYQGGEYILQDLADKLGLHAATLKYRVESGWPESRYAEKPNTGKAS